MVAVGASSHCHEHTHALDKKIQANLILFGSPSGLKRLCTLCFWYQHRLKFRFTVLPGHTLIEF